MKPGPADPEKGQDRTPCYLLGMTRNPGKIIQLVSKDKGPQKS